ncbi:MAG: ChbG/HpnK family deacetylase [Planctomycetia bacterium]|nr:ChbG/HpnK family deacetylase [Planctomycetia bacterium]
MVMTSEKSLLQLIVNADDLGLAVCVNDSILEGMTRGLITSASLMVNMPCAEDALKKWSRCQHEFQYGAGLGVHLSLTSGPAAISDTNGLLTTADGTFRFGFAGLVKALYSSGRKTFLDCVANELDGQLDRADEWAKRFNVQFDHIDSHQHVHVLPGIGALIEERAARRRLILRVPCERYGSWSRFARSCRLRFPSGIGKKIILDHYAAKSFKTKPAVGYFGIIDTGHMDTDSIRSVLNVIPAIASRTGLSAFEINLHPWNHEQIANNMLVCSGDDQRFARATGRSDEFHAVMKHVALLEQMKQLGIEPVGFDRIRKEYLL